MEKFDANDTMYFDQDLESVGKEIEKEYPEAEFNNLMTTDSSDPAGAESISWSLFGKVGAAEFMSAGAMDSPRVEVGGEKFTMPVHGIGLSYEVTETERRRDSMARKNIATRKAKGVVDGIEDKHDEIALWADGTDEYHKLYGVVYHPNTTKVEATATWSTLTPKQICQVIIDQYVAVQTGTNDMGKADTIALPPSWITYLRVTERVDNYGQKCIEFIQSSIDVKIVEHKRLKNAPKNPATLAVEANDIMLVYSTKKDNVQYIEPLPLTWLQPEHKARVSVMDSDSRTAGVRVYRPLEIICYYGF